MRWAPGLSLNRRKQTSERETEFSKDMKRVKLERGSSWIFESSLGLESQNVGSCSMKAAGAHRSGDQATQDPVNFYCHSSLCEF